MAEKKTTRRYKSKKHMARDQREAQQTRVILIITAIVGTLILGLVGYGVIDQLLIRPNKPVAEVGDTTITVRDFESYVQYTRVQLLNQTFQYYTFYQQFGDFGGNFLQIAQSTASQLAQPTTLGRNVLDEMIDNIIIKEEAEQLGISASEEEIDGAVQAAFGFFPEGTPTPTLTATLQSTPTLSETQLALVTLTNTPTPANIEDDNSDPTLTTTNQKNEDEDSESDEAQTEDAEEGAETTDDGQEIESPAEETPADLPSPTVVIEPTITLTPTPYTTQAYGENIKEFNNVYSTYNFDIKDLREVFEIQILREKLIEEITKDSDPVREEVWARHILVETEEEGLSVLALLDEGEDFYELAATYSIDESNSDNGGDLGWFDEGTMVPEFADAAFSLEVGEISDLVETNFGFHIVQVLGKRDAQIPPQEFEQEKQNAFNAWLTEQRNERDDIVIYDEWENYVPNTPEIPQQLLVELFQQQ